MDGLRWNRMLSGWSDNAPMQQSHSVQKSLHREKLALIITKTAYSPKRKQFHKFVLGRKTVAKLDSASFQAKKDTRLEDRKYSY